MLPKNPSKNKHCSKCISEEVMTGSAEIPNVLPPDQFQTMLREHQASIINIETKLKSISQKSKGNKPINEEIELIRVELDRKQNCDSENFMRNEMNKQEKEIKRLKDELRNLNENVVKSRYRNTNADAGKDIVDIKDQIVALTNLVKQSLNNVEERLYKIEDKHQDLKDMKRNKTFENRMEFKYALAKYNSGKQSEQRPVSQDKNNIFDRLSKKKS